MSTMQAHTRSTSGPRLALLVTVVIAATLFHCADAWAQRTLTSGTATPFKLAATPGGNFVLAESGTGLDDGRITLVSRWGGERYPLLSGLPSAMTAEGSASGPTGVAQSHRTLYVTLGTGDTIGAQQPPRSLPNPEGPSSPIFSSVLRARFYPVPDGIRVGFELSAENIQTLADGHEVILENDAGERTEIVLMADFRDLQPDPFTGVRDSNPFAAAVVGSLRPEDLVELGASQLSLATANFKGRLEPDSALGRRLEERTSIYVADAAMNTIDQLDATTGKWRVLAHIPPLPNPLFPNLGGPVMEAVPTGIHVRSDGNLLVSLLTGFPFSAGASRVLLIDRESGAITTYLDGLTTATDVLEVQGVTYVLEFSTDFLAQSPGRILRFAPGSAPTVVFGGLISPSAMVYDPSRNELLVSETFTGRIVRVALGH